MPIVMAPTRRAKPVREYPFPQANVPDRVIDVVLLAARGAGDDERLADLLGVHPRQARYYADAAAYLGLVRLSGGYWRPERSGTLMAQEDRPGVRNRMLADIIVEKPVFRETIDSYVQDGAMPSEERVLGWVLHDAETLNAVTSLRRAQTVLAWAKHVIEMTPELVEEAEARLEAATRPEVEQGYRMAG